MPKQMRDLCGRPVLRRTVELFASLPFNVGVIIAVSPSMRELWKQYCRRENFVFRHILVTGGLTRFHSVKNALDHVPDGASVAVHDAVRPLASVDMLLSLFDLGMRYPAVVPVVEVPDSVRRIAGSSSVTVDRAGLVTVQTPQVFHSEILKAAYCQPYDPAFTDDASVVERYGVPLHFTPGERTNIKLTFPSDIEFASRLLQAH